MIWRIRDRRTFQELRARGRRGRSGGLGVVVLRSDEADPPRVAFAVGRNFGSAPARNRVRRQLRAICRDLVRQNELPPGSYLISVAPSSSTYQFSELMWHLRRALDRAEQR